MRGLLLTLVTLLLSGCVSAPWQDGSCETATFRLEAGFEGARLGRCRALGESAIEVELVPEDEPPINPSPWYAFDVVSLDSAARSAEIRLTYTAAGHRYAPKRWQANENRWILLDEAAVRTNEDRSQSDITVGLESGPVRVAGQELVTSSHYQDWMSVLLERFPELTRASIGNSVLGAPLWMLRTQGGSDRSIVMIGRQHPPEVTGALAMMPYVEHLLSLKYSECGEDRACEWLSDVDLVFVPLVNPDGVDRGHWRHGMGGLDLNRDWGPFTQPETRAVRDLFAALDAEGQRPVVFLDFHSTNRNVFYTQSEADVTTPVEFAACWFAHASANFPVYEIDDARRHNEGQPISKNWVYERYGIPAITYELGDHTPRDEITRSSRAFAQAMVEVLAAPELCDENPS